MKLIFQPLLIVGSIYACSCSGPKVVVDKFKTVPGFEDACNVVVYDDIDSIPGNSEIIGSVNVLDNGMTSTRKCKFDKVVDIARTETANNGGNALFIMNHLQPSIWGSSCDQIFCKIIMTSDSIPLSNFEPQRAAMKENYSKQEEETLKRRCPKNSFSISAGPGFINSKFYDVNGSEIKPNTALSLQARYVWLNKKNRGLVVLYSGNSFGVEYLQYDYSDFYSNFVGIGFTSKFKTTGNWIWGYELGAGISVCKETHSSGITMKRSGPGFFYDLSCEYMISKDIGFNINASGNNGVYGTSEINGQSMTEAIGIISVNAGLSLYF